MSPRQVLAALPAGGPDGVFAASGYRPEGMKKPRSEEPRFFHASRFCRRHQFSYRLFLLSSSIICISLSDSLKSKMAMFSAICRTFPEPGMATKPAWMCHLRMICAGVLS